MNFKKCIRRSIEVPVVIGFQVVAFTMLHLVLVHEVMKDWLDEKPKDDRVSKESERTSS